MAQPFPNTLRSLGGDRLRGWLTTLAFVFVFGGAWAAWFVFARLPIYAVSDSARLEVVSAAHAVQAPVAGQFAAIRAPRGATVKAGDILIDLDGQAERLLLTEERTRLAAFGPQIARLESELAAVQRGRRETGRGALSAVEEARARLTEAQTAADIAAEEAARAARLHADGLVPELDFLRARSEAERRQNVVSTMRLQVDRMRSESLATDSEQDSRSERLQRERSLLEGRVATERAIVDRLEFDLEQRHIRAPIDGTVGEIADLRPGQFVNVGDRLAVIVPAGELRVIAQFPPSSALGRVRRGQPGRLRLDGFPWIQYGSVPTTVADVAGEARDGRIRVELRVPSERRPGIAFQHGMPGSVEVEVEQASPAGLMLRMTGEWLRR